MDRGIPFGIVLCKLLLERVEQRFAQLAQVACAYLELSSPSLWTRRYKQLVDARLHPGMRVVPMFLGVGKHVREDLPGMLQSPDEMQHPLIVVRTFSCRG
jgi:sirohydrochlorin ferrochelatase